MLSTLFLIGMFLLAFRWFASQSALTTAAGIPCVIVAGLIAMNFFEPWADGISRSKGVLSFFRAEPDLFSFLLLFLGVAIPTLRLVRSIPNPPNLPDHLEGHARLALTSIASYLIMAITLTAFDTSPRFQRMLGLSPDSAALFGVLSPDATWLSFVEVVSDGPLARKPFAMAQATGEDQEAAELFRGNPAKTFRHRFVEILLPVKQKPNDVSSPESGIDAQSG